MCLRVPCRMPRVFCGSWTVQQAFMIHLPKYCSNSFRLVPLHIHFTQRLIRHNITITNLYVVLIENSPSLVPFQEKTSQLA